jgi:hypothetical protein
MAFHACLGPAHLRATTYAILCENRGCAHDCLFLRTQHRTDNCLRVYWACPASHMMLVSRLGNKQPRTRHGKVGISPFLQSQFHTRISPPTFHFLLPSHTPVRLSFSLQYQADAQIKPHRLAAAVIDRLDAITTIRYAMPRHVLFLVFLPLRTIQPVTFRDLPLLESHHLRGSPTHAGGGFRTLRYDLWRIATDKETPPPAFPMLRERTWSIRFRGTEPVPYAGALGKDHAILRLAAANLSVAGNRLWQPERTSQPHHREH